LIAAPLVPDRSGPDKYGFPLRCTATGHGATLFSPSRAQDRAQQKLRFHVQGVVMRTILLGLVLLAGMKVWFQDHAYRTAMADAVVEAYRERAIEVCRRSATKRGAGARDDGASVWGSASATEAVIGNPDIDVAIWDTQNPLWGQRFRDPHLILTASQGGLGERCAYDVRAGGATVSLH
jgi:hypothetical protein